MAETSAAVTKAVVSRLRTAVPDLFGRVYSDVPQATPFPYALVSSSAVPFAANDFSGQTHALRVQLFSQADSKKELLLLQQAVFNALDRQEASLPLDASELIRFEYAMSDQPFKEDDGKTWQSVIEFSVDAV
ncbi:DUF3168 domain-containing protein [Methylorubrum sp. SB2]|uniref:DUF3168 domain-containing protein n=1 Tax=Methylorubrum subtropicum TaxID=3138812 RepID=UPI00313B3CB2